MTFDVTLFGYYANEVDKKYYVYILYSHKDKGLYIGFTHDLKNRLTLHSKGRVEATMLRIPVKLIHYEFFISEKDAKAREKYLKSGYGREQLKQILRGTLNDIINLSRH